MLIISFQDFDASNLSSIVPTWKGQQYVDFLPDDVCREILEEIFHVSFKCEFLLMDRYMYEVQSRDVPPEDGEVLDDLDASTREERNLKVIGALMFEMEVLGLAATDVEIRRQAFHGLYRVMKSWVNTLNLSAGTKRAAEKLSSASVSLEDLKLAEYRLAYHYIWSYATFFKRAPTLPYRL